MLPARAPTLFLDVDGVLNTAHMPGRHALHPMLLKRLAGVCAATHCEIVLSTTWRLQQEHEDVLLRALGAAGIQASVIVGRTPSLGISEMPWREGPNMGECRRACEIARYLDAHPEVKRFAIVDDIDVLDVDDDGVRARLAEHFVRTSVESGLTQSCCDRLVEMLSS
eukprot:CAMPEP_0119278428 /NCGR_PEP_ID=MMETSP1329-20130426/19073_1 /TAXON_ID=114041 /ORGANISM="Genus nov. species nov., Strain RCC1024" /LENGTH=166 /DNA_ID=CAMNT_0007278939 /DNA_START=626 /DNA_END=1123 /DNA_ORIENTATION=-